LGEPRAVGAFYWAIKLIDAILRKAVEAGASDVHLLPGSPPLFRIDTAVQPGAFSTLSEKDCHDIAKGLVREDRWAEFTRVRDADFSYEIQGLGRFRVNAHFQRGAIALAIRVICERVRSLGELFLPEIVTKLTTASRGLVLVTGPAGSGKSTTLAAMIEEINGRERGHIVTLEDPIEYVLKGTNCAIEQREVGADVPDFASGLRHVLRQDPDVILVGEMRDLETIGAAITAAETGHLVLSTLHTVNAPQTVERIIDAYPPGQQGQIRSMLANTLQAVVSQTLLPRCDQRGPDEAGMIPAAEIMLCNQAVKSCIRESRVFEIPNVIETSRGIGMQSLDWSIQQLYRNGYITRQTAVEFAAQPEKVERALAA
jgi:twitching motility protein PilT